MILNVIFTLAALVAILDYFGIKPAKPLWGISVPYSKNWKLVVMLLLVAAGLGMSGYSAYRAYHPKIVEKIIEKPVLQVCPTSSPLSATVKPSTRPTPAEIPVKVGSPITQTNHGDNNSNVVGNGNKF